MVNNKGQFKDKKEEENLKKYTKQAKFLKTCILYLETNPKEETVVSCLSEAERRLEVIETGFTPWLINDQAIPEDKIFMIDPERMVSLKGTYNNLCQKSKVKSQIKTLKFLLS